MSAPSAQIRTLLSTAAELRAGGTSWETIAKQLHRHERTCRRWPLQFAADWQRFYRAAEERLLCEASAEALHILRTLLRAKDAWLCQNTAKYLLTQRLEAGQRTGEAQPDVAEDEWTRIADYLRSLTEPERDKLLEELTTPSVKSNGPPVPALESPSSVQATDPDSSSQTGLDC